MGTRWGRRRFANAMYRFMCRLGARRTRIAHELHMGQTTRSTQLLRPARARLPAAHAAPASYARFAELMRRPGPRFALRLENGLDTRYRSC